VATNGGAQITAPLIGAPEALRRLPVDGRLVTRPVRSVSGSLEPVFRLTIRSGPKVARERHESLGEAIAALRSHAESIRAEGVLPEVAMIRTYEPADRVKARLEVSTGGPFRGRDAGIDVMGDGRLVPYRGGVFRKELGTDAGSPYEAVERALAEGAR
jgi:hypothetical protein